MNATLENRAAISPNGQSTRKSPGNGGGCEIFRAGRAGVLRTRFLVNEVVRWDFGIPNEEVRGN